LVTSDRSITKMTERVEAGRDLKWAFHNGYVQHLELLIDKLQFLRNNKCD